MRKILIYLLLIILIDSSNEIEGNCGDDQSYSECYDCTHLHLQSQYKYCILIDYETEAETINRCVPMTADEYKDLDNFQKNKLKEFEEKYGTYRGYTFHFCGVQPCVDEAKTSDECKSLGIINNYRCCFEEWKREYEGKVYEGSLCMNLKPMEYINIDEYKKKRIEKLVENGNKVLEYGVDCFITSSSAISYQYLKIYSLMSILFLL